MLRRIVRLPDAGSICGLVAEALAVGVSDVMPVTCGYCGKSFDLPDTRRRRYCPGGVCFAKSRLAKIKASLKKRYWSDPAYRQARKGAAKATRCKL